MAIARKSTWTLDGDIDQDGTKEEDLSRGNLSGTYEVSADVFALSVDYRF